VANIIHQGGTMLGTARSTEFRTREGRAQATAVLKQAGIEGLILIGGDGTFRGGSLLAGENGIGIIGVPATIDNDIYGTDYSIGFDTAINCALEAIDRIRDTAQSHERLFFVEVMGHHTGFIALESGLAGGVEELIIPEAPTDTDELCRRLEESFKRDKRSAIVVVAEGEQPGDSFRIAQAVKNKLGFESKVCILGHIQRGGAPTARDRLMAIKLGTAAVRALMAGWTGQMVGEIGSQTTLSPLKDACENKKKLNPDLTELMKLMRE
jgi:6-phosphofructokinase 1